jgi:hypothetical protein
MLKAVCRPWLIRCMAEALVFITFCWNIFSGMASVCLGVLFIGGGRRVGGSVVVRMHGGRSKPGGVGTWCYASPIAGSSIQGSGCIKEHSHYRLGQDLAFFLYPFASTRPGSTLGHLECSCSGCGSVALKSLEW